MEKNQEKPTVSSPTCTQLLCCPFCGSEATASDSFVGCTSVDCEVHSFVATFDSDKAGEKEDAVKAWNKRVT